MKTKISDLKLQMIKTLLYAGFGAFGIVISIKDGKITDHAIKIKDKTIKDILELLK